MNNEIDIFQHYTQEEIFDFIDGVLKALEYEASRCENGYKTMTKSKWNLYESHIAGKWSKFTDRIKPLIRVLEQACKALETKDS